MSIARYLLTLAFSPPSMPWHCSFLYQCCVAELADSYDPGPAGRLTLRRAELPFANNRRFIPACKENNHEAGRTKKFPAAQVSKEAPCHEEVRSGAENKGVIA
jgi:hypothetical protein